MFTLFVVAAALALLMTGTMTGILGAFSVSVMPALDRIPAEQAVAAMRSINRVILNPVFLLMFIGAPVAAAAAGLLGFPLGQGAAAWLFLAAAAVYLLGVIMPTAVVNVPLNNRLDAGEAQPSGEEAARMWAAHSPRWTRWNTGRTLLGAVSLLLIGLGLLAYA